MLDDLLNSMMEGAGTGSEDQAGGDPLADLLGSLVSGGTGWDNGETGTLSLGEAALPPSSRGLLFMLR